MLSLTTEGVQGSTPQPLTLLGLPAELRNKIYEEVLNLATTCQHVREELPLIFAAVSHGRVITKNIGALPMLFTNKQVFSELVGLAYGRFSYVRLVALALNGAAREGFMPWPGLLLVPTLKVDFYGRTTKAKKALEQWRRLRFLQTQFSDCKLSAAGEMGGLVELELDSIQSHIQEMREMKVLEINVRHVSLWDWDAQVQLGEDIREGRSLFSVFPNMVIEEGKWQRGGRACVKWVEETKEPLRLGGWRGTVTKISSQ